MATTNIGITGPESARFGDKKIDELPMVQAAHAKAGMQDLYKSDLENRIAEVRAKYPATPIPSIDGFLNECKDNLYRIRNFITDQEQRISEYSGHISLCKHRDKMIAKLDPEADAEEIKDLKKQFPPYNVSAMQQQIKQFKEAIEKAHHVIDQEQRSISELKVLKTQCEMRDKELTALGVSV